MTNKQKRFLMYARGTVLGLLTMAAACTKAEIDTKDNGDNNNNNNNNNNEQKLGPLQTKTEQVIVDLRAQNVAATETKEKIQKVFQATTRASTLEDKIAAQEILIANATTVYNDLYAQVKTGANSIPGFVTAAQNYAVKTPLDMNDFRQRVIMFIDFAADIKAGTNPDISYSSLSVPQKDLLSRFQNAAADLEGAFEIMARYTGGTERANQQINDVQAWIHDLSLEIVDILESASGTQVSVRSTSGETLPTETILQNAKELMSTLSEEKLAPYSTRIDKLNSEIKMVQIGLNGIIKFWADLENKPVAQAKVVPSMRKQQMLARNYASKSVPVQMARYKNKNVRVRV